MDRENLQLHEKNGDLDLQNQTLIQELQQAREEVQALKLSANQPIASEDIAKKDAQIEQQLRQIYELQCKIHEAKEQAEAKETDHKVELEGLRRKISKPAPTNALPNLEEIRDRFLKSLKLGKQSPEYKRTKFAVEKFIEFLKTAAID